MAQGNLTAQQRGNVAFQNVASQAKGSDAVTTLHVGGLYPGVVNAVDLVAGTMQVRVQGFIISNCKFAAAVGASYLGVSTVNLPPRDSNVLLWYWPDGSYVLGTGAKYIDSSFNPPATGDEQFDVLEKGPSLGVTAKKDKRVIAPGPTLPIDMLPGEWAMDTGIGPVFRLLYNFAQMSAGDLAKIEVHLINDMVRVVSNEFRHHSVGGDDLIWSDGWHNNHETHFTSYSFEAEGKQEENESFAEEGDGKYKNLTEDDEPNKYNATGRWRYSTYLGFLGDMVHTWITRPTEVLSNTMEDAFRGCNFRQWIGQDGTFFIQSGMAVQIEVNPFQVVPAIIKGHNDPTFNPQDQQLKLESSFLKIWGNGPDWKDLKVSCWQMRTYLKYIPLWHSLARFKQMEQNQYCQIPTEDEVPEFMPNAEEEDKQQVNSSADGKPEIKGYAAIAMDITGNISLISGDHTSVIMSNGSIQIACPGNLELKAGGTVSIQGKEMILHAAKDIEFMSFFGGIYSKARTCLNYLCEKGRLWFKSDAKEDDDDAGDYPLSDEQPEAQIKKYGIIFDTAETKILALGGKGFEAVTTEKEGHIIFQTSGAESDIKFSSMQNLVFKTVKNIFLKSIGLAIGAARTFFASSIIKIGEQMKIAGGSILTKGMVQTSSVMSKGGYIGPSKYNGESDDLEDPDTSDDGCDELKDEMEEKTEQEEVKSKYDEEEMNEAEWKLPEWKNDQGEDVESPFSYKASMLDDYGVILEGKGVETATIYDTMLIAARRTSPTNLPWPGKEGKMFFSMGGSDKSFSEPWDRPFTENDIGGVDKLSPRPYTLVFSKQDEFDNKP